MKFYFSFFVLSFALPSIEARNSRIIGGTEAHAAQFSYATAIHVTSQDSKHFCGGALIGDRWILTAAQCLDKAISFTIQLGSNSLHGEDLTKITVVTSEYFVHPNYDPVTLDSDIGLIHLRMAIEFSDYIKPILLSIDEIPGKWEVLTFGWGQLNDYDPEFAPNLNFVILESLTNEECKITYGSAITDNMVCAAGNYNEGTCIGDTGNPLVYVGFRFHQLYAISSFHSGNGCESPDPSGFTRVYPFIDWIVNLTGIVLP